MVRSIYDRAKKETGEEAYVFHQMGIYEMNRPGGDLNESSSLLTRAAQLNQNDPTIKHSTAELRLKAAELSKSDLQREKLLRDAFEITNALKSEQREDSYAFVTAAKIAIAKLQIAIKADEPDSVIESLVRDAERNLSEGLQRFPGDSYLFDADANLAQLVSDDDRVLTSLKKAFSANPRSGYLAARLAKDHIRKSSFADAKDVLEAGLEANPNDHRLRYLLAKLLIETESGTPDEIEYNLARSFTEGDNNHDAQLLYGRQLYLDGKRPESKLIFDRLSKMRVPNSVKNAPLYPLRTLSRGRVIRLEATYGFIAVDGSGDWLHMHQSDVSELSWEDLARGVRVKFRIAFTMRGAKATQVVVDRH